MSYDIPLWWFVSGSDPYSYEMGIDIGTGRTSGTNSLTIKSVTKHPAGYGTLMSNFFADEYKGKRIRFSGYMRTENVLGGAYYFFRIDHENTRKPISFDNMANRPIRGTTPWTKYELVLDVPDSAFTVSYGAFLDGPGQIWFIDMDFEVVNNSVPQTGLSVEQLNKAFNMATIVDQETDN